MHDNRFNDPKFIVWSKACKVRDNFTCQLCEKRGVELNSHHKNSWDKYINQRYDLENSITLCFKCHTRFHDIYGYGNNTQYQFEQFVDIYTTLRKIAAKYAENIENKNYMKKS